MGLAGRKVKQRIPNDPRNLSWADDAARFGSNYLAKFGWDASKGLGASGEGRLSHVKVTQKLDMMGIGAAHQNDPNGIAWKQNRDFENLLKRLNEGSEIQTATSTIDGFKKVEEGKEETIEDSAASVEGEKKKTKRKDKESAEDEYEHKKKKRKRGEVVVVESTSLVVDKAVVEVKKPVVPRHRAHRARAIAAKNISSKSAAHISEILGIAPTPSSFSPTPTPNSVPEQGKLTSLTDPEGQLELEKITTSTQSLAAYFKEKLASKTSGSATPSSASPSTPVDADDAYATSRMGLGSSRAKLEVQVETLTVHEATQRMGLSKFSALTSSSFLASTSLPSTSTPASANVEDVEPLSECEEDEAVVKKKKEKKRAKKPATEEETDVEKKERKKDKKGKDKVIEPEAEGSGVEEEGKMEKKKKKKEKRQKAEELPNENAAEGPDSANADETTSDGIEPKSRKEKKRKSKSEAPEMAPGAEVDKKSKKEKKKHRTSGDDS